MPKGVFFKNYVGLIKGGKDLTDKKVAEILSQK